MDSKNEQRPATLTDAQIGKLGEPAAGSLVVTYGEVNYLHASTFRRTREFHRAMDLGTPTQPITPTVTQRLLRGNLILEEFLELLEAMGLELHMNWDEGLQLSHIEGSRYDVVEVADALGDLDVVVNGSAIEFGINLPSVGYEIFCSNMSKLDDDGKPIVNKCRHWIDESEVPSAEDGQKAVEETKSFCNDQLNGRESCSHPEHWTNPKNPLGKRLKGPNYIPPNIPRVLFGQ